MLQSRFPFDCMINALLEKCKGHEHTVLCNHDQDCMDREGSVKKKAVLDYYQYSLGYILDLQLKMPELQNT